MAGWPVEVNRPDVTLDDVEAWCAAMRGRGGGGGEPLYVAERNGHATRLTGWPGMTVGDPPDGQPVEVELDAPGRELEPVMAMAEAFAVAVATVRATGRPAWVTEHGTRVAVILAVPEGTGGGGG
jgi:hypothetical protein